MNIIDLKRFVLGVALTVISTMASAEINTTGITNPECLSLINKLDVALDKAHADKQFLNVTLDHDTPANLDNDMCNANFVIAVKDKKEYERIQDGLLKFMGGVTSQDFSKPNSFTVKEI